MPRANSLTRSLDELTVGQLRAVLAWGGDERTTVADALAGMAETDAIIAAHEIDVRAFDAYRARRETRRAAALATAATAADKASRRDGDGARMAARQAARVEAHETFEGREPLLDFADWQSAGKPDVHEVGAFRRAVRTVTELVQ